MKTITEKTGKISFLVGSFALSFSLKVTKVFQPFLQDLAVFAGSGWGWRRFRLWLFQFLADGEYREIAVRGLGCIPEASIAENDAWHGL
jgi:hypothetical protein